MPTPISKTLISYCLLSLCALLTIWGEATATEVDDIAQVRHSSSTRIKQFGTAGEEQAYKSVLDGQGNLYVTGYTTGDLDGPGPEVNAGSYDIYVMKLNPKGQIKWIRQFGTAEEDRAHSIALDHRGYVYVAAHTDGDLDGVGTETHHGGGDTVILKLDEYGQLQWLRQFGTSADEMGLNFTLDALGNPYVVGFTEGDIDGDGPDVPAGYYDVFLAAFDAAGNQRWIRQVGSPDDDLAYGVAVDARGNIYATGYSYGDLDGSGSQVSAGGADIVVLKFNGYGESRWIRQLGTPGEDYGYALASDHHDRLYIAGFVSGDLDGDGPGMHAGGMDFAVIKMFRNGGLLWQRQIGTPGTDWGHGIAVGRSGAVYVTGAFSGDIDGSGPQVYYGMRDVAVIKLCRYGTTQWIRQWGTPGNDFGLDVLLDRKQIYVTGQTQGDLDGPGPQTHAGDFDAFVLKLRRTPKRMHR